MEHLIGKGEIEVMKFSEGRPPPVLIAYVCRQPNLIQEISPQHTPKLTQGTPQACVTDCFREEPEGDLVSSGHEFPLKFQEI